MSERKAIKEIIKELKTSGVIKDNPDIAHRMGYTRPGTISDNLKKEPLDDKFLALFCTTFDIPIHRIRRSVKSSSLSIPKKNNLVEFYQDVVLTGGATEAYNGNARTAPLFINLGGAFSDATGAMQVSGHSMYPNYESGCIVGYREIQDKSYFVPGEAYIIGTNDYQMLKRVQKSDKAGCISLTSDNNEPDKSGRLKYEQFDLEVDKIKFLAIVLGKISRTQMKLIVPKNP